MTAVYTVDSFIWPQFSSTLLFSSQLFKHFICPGVFPLASVQLHFTVLNFVVPHGLTVNWGPPRKSFKCTKTKLDIPLRKPFNHSRVETQLLFTLPCGPPQMTDKCHRSISSWGWCCHGYYRSCMLSLLLHSCYAGLCETGFLFSLCQEF